MPTRKRKDAAERGRLSSRLAQPSRKKQLRPADSCGLEDPWQSFDPWEMAELGNAVDLPGQDHLQLWPVEDGDIIAARDPWELAESRGSQVAPIKVELGLAMAAAAQSAHSQGLLAEPSRYANQGKWSSRVAKVCGQACSRHCRLQGCQSNGLPAATVLSFVDGFWSLPQDHRAHCLRTSYYSGEMSWNSPEVQWSRVQPQKRTWHIADTPVCFARLCSVLGTGQRTLRRMIAGAPDGRRKLPGVPAPPKPAEQLVKCNTFFTELHQSAAVPDPEDVNCAGFSSPGVQGSPWENWDYDWGGVSPLTVACQARVLGLPTRYIGHCRLLDLYWQMSSEWSVLLELRPDIGAMPSFTTFVRCYKQHWQKLLVIRKESQHARCQLCSDLQRVMQKSNVAWAERTAAAQQLRQHLRDQYTDRMLYWSMRWSSRQVVQPDVLCIIIDSMGKWGSAWPKFHHDKTPHELERIARPTMILTAALAHGWSVGLFLSLEPFGHGSASKPAHNRL
jgi:hypothetical protein